MSATWYMTDSYSYKIEPVTVLSSTDKTVTYIDRRWRGNQETRAKRKTSSRAFHETWQDAHKHLVDRESAHIDHYAKELRRAQEHFDALLKMTPPAESA